MSPCALSDSRVVENMSFFVGPTAASVRRNYSANGGGERMAHKRGANQTPTICSENPSIPTVARGGDAGISDLIANRRI